MEKKRTLIVNTGLCDTRKVREETLEGYEKIILNSGVILVDRASRAILDRYPVIVNGDMIETDEEVSVSKFEGFAEIGPAQAAGAGKRILKGSGTLNILPGSEEALKSYISIKMSGTVNCPESLAGSLSMLKLSGALCAYPDGAILLKDTAVLDRTFHLRAKQDARYFAGRRVVALSPDIAFDKLAEKNVSFLTRELLVAESLVGSAVPLFDEKAEITILPDGCAYVGSDATLDENLLRRHGGRLYVRGDLTIPKESGDLLPQLTYLFVKGDIRLPQALVPALMELEQVEYSALKPMVGTLMEDHITLVVDRDLLENAVDGLSIVNCVNVKFKEDVPPQLIREKLRSIEDCVNVSCTEEQRSAIQPVATEVVRLGPGSGKTGGWVGEILQSVLGDREDAGGEAPTPGSSAQIINGGSYIL